ncbi:hypothetical protein B0T21DRAFT_362986 [Apiosordaria backusii]|uniref:Uncharacterized protein n=1 Tax=Apiosordaria backusii TaxID=314023 RepID=A0AA40BSN3_9PEZI|nr:hypothetical protein B0T21DRAFT_362986 [Apiosordaria backusii]
MWVIYLIHPAGYCQSSPRVAMGLALPHMVTENSGTKDKEGKEALMAGYGGAFRTAFGIALATTMVGLVGFKGVRIDDRGKDTDIEDRG